MFTMNANHTAIGAMAAVAIVAFGGLVMDQAYLAAAPEGTIEVGEPTALDAGTIRLAQLPEVVVVGKRDFGTHYAAATVLPEIVVVAKRAAHLVAKDDDSQRLEVPAINAGL